MGISEQYSPPYRDIIASEPQINSVCGGEQPVSAMSQLAEDQQGILSSWHNSLQPLGCSVSAWMGLAGIAL